MSFSEFDTIPTYQSMGLYLQLLYAAEYESALLPYQLRTAFPGDAVVALETPRCRLKLGRVHPAVVNAITDLLNDGLLALSVSHWQPSEPMFVEGLDLLCRTGKITPEQKAAIEKDALSRDPEFQGASYWYLDKNDQRIDLAEMGVNALFTLTDIGKKLFALMPSMRERLTNEIMETALPDSRIRRPMGGTPPPTE